MFSIFSISFLNVLLNYSILLPSLVSIFMTIPLNSLSVFFFQSFFWGFVLFVHLERINSSSFCLTFRVSFYVLGTSVISPSSERMTFCRKCFVGPSGAIPLVTGARCSRVYPLCGFCVPAGLFVAGALVGMVCSQSSGWENLLWL